MATTDLRKTDIIDMTDVVTNYEVASVVPDGVSSQKETEWTNSNFYTYFGFYDEIQEYKSAINAFATWVIGQGYTCASSRQQILLNNIKGWGEDTFQSILWNMIVMKKVGGDSYAEIIREPESNFLINLKPLDPGTIRHVVDGNGILLRYEQIAKTGDRKKTLRTFKPEEILHFCNDRVADQIHGTAVTKSLMWVLKAIQEALTDKKRQLHLSTIRVMEVDDDSPEGLAKIQEQYGQAIEHGAVMLVPKGYGAIQDLAPPVTEHLAWLKYQEDRFYRALGVPKVILGGTSENTEASAKVAVIVYEPIFTREIHEIEADVKAQLGIEIKINKQPSLMDNMQRDEKKNTGQLGFQQNDVTYGSGK